MYYFLLHVFRVFLKFFFLSFACFLWKKCTPTASHFLFIKAEILEFQKSRILKF